jgi:hypothetical protein
MLDSGAPYFVMELLEGQDLASMLATRGPIAVPILADYLLQACLGLAEAHAAQIVHRDLKPANLFLTVRPDGTPLIKLVDFGIAKAAASGNFHLTRTDAVMGSPGYMSPEQLRSTRIADARSDIWALGVILYELATGRPPFSAESITDLALRIAMDPTPPLRGAPPGFERVVHRCLEKEPARRFQDVGQLATALAPFGGPAVRERALGVTRVLSAKPGASMSAPAVAVSAAPTTLGSSAASLERAPVDRRRWGIVFAGLVVGALAAVAFVNLRGGDAPIEPVAAPSAPPSTSPDAAIPDASSPSLAAVTPAAAAPPVDTAVPVDAAQPSDAAVPVDAASRPHSAPPVHKVTRPGPRPQPGSDDDVAGSRL